MSFNELPIYNKVFIFYYVLSYLINTIFGPQALYFPKMTFNIIRCPGDFKRFIFMSYIGFLLNAYFLYKPTKINYINAVLLNTVATIGHFKYRSEKKIGNYLHLINLLIVGIYGSYILCKKEKAYDISTIVLLIYISLIFIFKSFVYEL